MFTKFYRTIFSTAFSLFIAPLSLLQADAISWDLPQELNDQNTTVLFEVDSTWHLVKGKTAGLVGRVWLADPTDPLSITSSLLLPVAQFNTAGEGRDNKLRKVMAENLFPNVIFTTTRLSSECHPSRFTSAQDCQGFLTAKLTIRSIEKEIMLPVTIHYADRTFTISGKYSLEWAQYGVEDPSILVAKLDPVVNITFSATIPASGGK